MNKDLAKYFRVTPEQSMPVTLWYIDENGKLQKAELQAGAVACTWEGGADNLMKVVWNAFPGYKVKYTYYRSSGTPTIGWADSSDGRAFSQVYVSGTYTVDIRLYSEDKTTPYGTQITKTFTKP